MNTIDPHRVRFTQASVRRTFRDGQTIDQLVEELHDGTTDASDLPPIRLFERSGKLFTLDNRRLLAFQMAGLPVPYRMATPDEIREEAWKMTTTNEGTSIRVR